MSDIIGEFDSEEWTQPVLDQFWKSIYSILVHDANLMHSKALYCDPNTRNASFSSVSLSISSYYISLFISNSP